MPNRITRKVVVFAEPFQLGGMETTFPAGPYDVTTEEEPLGDLMIPVYRRLSTTIYLPPPSGQIGLGEFVDIDPAELEAVLLSQRKEPQRFDSGTPSKRPA